MTKDELRARIQRSSEHRPVPAIKLADGEHILVQAGKFSYCFPRENSAAWVEVECGFPSFVPSSDMMTYCENPESPTQTVYGYVPIEIVLAEIEAHGGPHSDDSRD